MRKTVLITGGAGFIGSAVCRRFVDSGRWQVVNIDKLTYAGNLESLQSVAGRRTYEFHRLDIADDRMASIVQQTAPDAIVHLAAESHVDRSIDGPDSFVSTNVVGTFRLLQAALRFWRGLNTARRNAFRFLHVSTDEVFGDLDFDDTRFHENTPYSPSSPYAASKAASDHFARAWYATYGLPVIVSNSSNNYGPFQYPEKFIPLAILAAMGGSPVPIYGSGNNVRDWLFVDDHAAALEAILDHGKAGESYNLGGDCEMDNLGVAHRICDHLDKRNPLGQGRSHRELIEFVADRPGHDRRYAMDITKIRREIGWQPTTSFDTGLARTVDWYADNESWLRQIRERYRGERLGLAIS